MVVLYETRARDGIGEVGVVAVVLISQTHALCRGDILGSREHLDILIDRFHTPRAVVGDMERGARAFLRRHLDDTGGTTRTVLCRLGSITKDSEALDVGRIDSRECGEVRVDAIDDDQRVVAACERRCTTYTHRRELCHAVLTIGDVHTGRLTVEG